VPLFKAAGLPLEALPFKKEEKGDEVVVCVPYTDDEGPCAQVSAANAAS